MVRATCFAMPLRDTASLSHKVTAAIFSETVKATTIKLDAFNN